MRLKPWWRSVGFWVGLWGMMFLVWVWVDSFVNYSVVSVWDHVEPKGGMPFDCCGWSVALTGGKVILAKDVILGMRPGTRVTRGDLTFTRSRHVYPIAGEGLWGEKRGWEVPREIDPIEGMRTEDLEQWVLFEVVMVSYAVVWLGSLVMWRRWLGSRNVWTGMDRMDGMRR